MEGGGSIEEEHIFYHDGEHLFYHDGTQFFSHDDSGCDHDGEDDVSYKDGDGNDGVHPNSHKHFIPYMGFCASIWDSVRHHCHHHHHHDHQK